MGVAEAAGVLSNPPDYYRIGGNVIGGLVCRSTQGNVYFDPFSGTFPGSTEAVTEAESELRAFCAALSFPYQDYSHVPIAARVDQSKY